MCELEHKKSSTEDTNEELPSAKRQKLESTGDQ